MRAEAGREGARWRWLLRLAVVLLLIAPLFALAYAYAYYTADEPSPFDADLMFQPRVVPAEENGFVTLLGLSEADVLWPDGGQTVEGHVFAEDQLYSMTRGEAWDSLAARKLLERNARALVELDRALAQPEFVDTAREILKPGVWRRLCYTQQVRAWLLFHEGSEREAFGETLKILRFGAKLEESRGPIVRCILGASYMELGVETLERLRQKTRLEPVEITRTAAALRELASRTEPLMDSVRVEYGMQVRLLELIGTGKADVDLIYGRGGTAGLLVWGGRSLCFKLNHTKRLFAEFSRALIAKLEGKDANPEPVDVYKLVDGPVDRRWPSRNFVGRFFAETNLSSLQRALKECRRIDARIMALADSLDR